MPTATSTWQGSGTWMPTRSTAASCTRRVFRGGPTAAPSLCPCSSPTPATSSVRRSSPLAWSHRCGTARSAGRLLRPGDIPIEGGKLSPEHPDVLTVRLERPLNDLQVISDLGAEVLQVAPRLLMPGFDSLDRGTVL